MTLEFKKRTTGDPNGTEDQKLRFAKTQRCKARNSFRREDRQEAALLRTNRRRDRTRLQQLMELDSRLGSGRGAKKERARLIST